MPRNYKRRLGSLRYVDYAPEILEAALKKMVEDGWSLRQASAAHNIPFGTLRNKYMGIRTLKSEGQTVFSNAEELAFVKAVTICSDWGFPLTLTDLRYIAKSYLDSQGRNIGKFRANMPGTDWARSFLQRHKKDIRQKVASNIKRARANVSREDIVHYFENLSETLKDIPACNIFNYDETNVQDDPGKQKMLFRRGTKYPERICNFTKTATTIMMCGSASGVLLPPYVIHKAEKMWKQWIELGPKGEPCCNNRCCSVGSRYNRTQHGWMDAQTFTDWFESAFLPHAKSLPGRKVLIGDNLSSHFTESVLRQCGENDVAFVCLPKCSTNLTQPLDVGFYRPFKIAWRSSLTKWKNTHLHQSTLDKKDFPSLLASTLVETNQKHNNAIKEDLISSFRATGIAPLDAERVLRKIPSQTTDTNTEDALGNVIVGYLQQQRFMVGPSRRNMRRQKLSVDSGKSVVPNEESSDSETNDDPHTNDSSSENSLDTIAEPETEYFELRQRDIFPGKFLVVKVLYPAGDSKIEIMNTK
ncbi:unnamed protein product [Acanthoscelides obtectus]|uniref:DDE-1 domain-containing protein n=1 Tax=Acanthoscelides obtectus TaxID=200917 RepID=A0A9P0QCU4_ACAOB|nr:unnamed protein product [Acanthoscelides obtectus]CAK1684701.1 Jerky protein homolog-like [Acanthoscelides obtectus]